jgi:hypothetical protein
LEIPDNAAGAVILALMSVPIFTVFFRSMKRRLERLREPFRSRRPVSDSEFMAKFGLDGEQHQKATACLSTHVEEPGRME